MYSGWTVPFETARPLTQKEQRQVLMRERGLDVEPGQRAALIALNSTYLDWIDRRFLFRGTLNTFLSTLFVIGAIVAVSSAQWMIISGGTSIRECWPALIIPIPAYVACWYLYYMALRGEYFTYTYWPIRFNRKTRMVHVFRYNGPGGTLSVPWDEVFFHIGAGSQKRPDDIDIRGHVLDGDIVKDTFALGHTVPRQHKRALLEMWEFIRRYMDEGPDAVGPHPLDRYIEVSVTPSLFNCFFMMHTFYVGGFPMIAQILAFPFVVLYTLTRWFVLHTCRKPVFPPEVEATCQIEPGDLNVWPVPRKCAEFVKTVPGLFEYIMAKEQRARNAEQQTLGK